MSAEWNSSVTLEAFVVSELRKQRTWSRKRFRLFHFRQRDEEVDIVIELAGGQVILVEVKSAMDVDQRSWKNLVSLRSKLGDRVAAAVVLYAGRTSATVRLADGPVYVLPVQSLWEHP